MNPALMRVVVLRLGHRPERDKRITTHVGLVSRALGAEEMLLTGRDDGVVASLDDVALRWGGGFRVRQGVRWKDEVRRFKEAGGMIVHLTMYGLGLAQAMPEIKEAYKSCDIMVVIGAEKVPGAVYGMADWNLAVGGQPHSEVAALAIFLDRLMEGRGLDREFPGGIKIVPTIRGKRISDASEAASEEASGDESAGVGQGP